MRKHGGKPSRRGKFLTLAATSPHGVARGRFVEGHQIGLAGSSSAGLFLYRYKSDARGNHGAPLHDRVHLPIYLPRLGWGLCKF